MKLRMNLFLPLSAAIALGFAPSLHAAALTWTGGNGTWQVGNAGGWGTNWADGDTATFNGTNGTVTLGGAVTTGNAALAFSGGNYTISAATPLAIALGNTAINLGAVTTTIGANVTLNRDTWFVDGATTATSTFNLTGGSLVTVTGNPNTNIREATVNVNTGSLLRTGGSLICGTTADGAALNVSGGTVTIEGSNNSLLLNNSGATVSSVTVTLSSGAISFTNSSNPAGLRFAAQTGIFNLDGGVLTVGRIFETGTPTSTFNFNGGTLRASRTNTTDFMAGLNNALVKSDGAIIDTNTFNLTIGQSLTPGPGSTGGLTKNSLGTLTLSGASTYTGATSVTAGRLNVSGSLTSAVNVASGATLGGEGSVSASPVFAATGSIFAFDPATPAAFTASTLSLGSSIIQLSNDTAMTNGISYLVMTNSAGFSGSPATNFRSPSRGVLAFSGNNLNFTPSASASITWKGNDVTNPTFCDVDTTTNWDNGGPDKFFNSDTVTFDDTATSFNVAIQGSSIKPAAVTFNNSTTYNLSGGAIEGAIGITKNGSGIVTLGNANTYSGTTTINAGTVQVSGGGAIINAGLVTLADAVGASFRVVGSETIGAISGGGASGGNLSLDSAQTLTLSSGTQTLAGTVSGLGTLTVAGALQTLTGVVSNSGGINVTSGRLTLDANNTYTGATTVSANTGVIVSKANGLGATGASNGTTILGAGDAASGQIGLSGGFSFPAEKIVGSGNGHVTPATVNGFTAQQRGIVQSVSGNNTFAGDIEINSTGTTRFGTQDGASLTLSGNITRSIGVTGVTVLFRVGNTGGDFITLSGAGNDFDEVSLFSASSLGNTGVRLGVDDALPVQALVKAANASPLLTTLDLDGYDQTIGGLTTDPNSGGQYKIINRNLGDTSTLTFANIQDTSTILAAISNDGGAGGSINVVKTGVFTQGLGAANTFLGTTSIQGGRLDFLQQVSLYNNASGSWTPANISVNSGATLGLSVGGAGEFTATDVGTLITNLTAINNNGLQAGSTLGLIVAVDTDVTTALTNSSGPGSGAIGLHKSGTAKLTLSGANSYSGDTTVAVGALQLNSANTNNQASTVTIAATGATLLLNFGGSDTVDKLFIGNTQQPLGTYGHTSTGATNGGAGVGALDAYFPVGTGTLNVITGPGGYTAWKNENGTTGTLDQDHDFDGVDNGTEYFLFGTGNSTGFTPLPGVTSNSVTWVKAASYTGAYNTDFVVEISTSLATGSWTTAPLGVGAGNVEIIGLNNVKYTFPAGTKNFARLKVTGP